MRSCFYVMGVLTCLPLLAIFVFWFMNGSGNRYDVGRLQGEIQQNVLVGSSKAQIITWLKSKNFTIYRDCFDASHKNKQGDYLNYGNPKNTHVEHDLLGRKNYTRSEIVCAYDVIVTFAFDKNDKLIRSGVREFSACL